MYPNQIYKIILDSDLLQIVNKQSDINFKASELPELISEALTFENFCLRHYSPILKRLKEENLIGDNFKNLVDSINLNEVEKKSFSYPDYYKQEFFKDNSPPSTKSPVGYFGVWFKYDYKYELIKNTLLKNYKSQLTDKFEDIVKNKVFVSVDEIDRFLNEFGDCDAIQFYTITQETSINWNNELLTKYKDIWDWKYVHTNPKIEIDFNLIELNYDKLDWSIISGDNNLIWNIENLERWQEYLIFSMSGCSSNVKNKLGNLINKSYLSNSISNSTSVKWNKNILKKFIDYFDWYELSKNESIGWNIELLNEFSEQVDFETLSSNLNVVWSEELIEKFKDKLDWNNLSGNPNLPWSNQFLKRYESLLSWIPKIYSSHHEECINEPSISGNTGINWTEELIDAFKEKIDFWIIARVGKIDIKITQKYNQEFYRKEHVGFIFHSSSDNRETENVLVNGWQNLTKNPNFYLDIEIIPFYYNNKIPISYSNGNLASANQNSIIKTEEVRLLEILKNTNTNLTQNDLIDNEFGWTKILINENFINESIWLYLVKPFINKLGVDVFLEKLKSTVLNNVS